MRSEQHGLGNTNSASTMPRSRSTTRTGRRPRACWPARSARTSADVRPVELPFTNVHCWAIAGVVGVWARASPQLYSAALLVQLLCDLEHFLRRVVGREGAVVAQKIGHLAPVRRSGATTSRAGATTATGVTGL